MSSSNNEKDFIQLISKFIDSITAINQSLGSNRELIATLIQKIDFQKSDNEKIEKALQEIRIDIEAILDISNKNDSILEIFKSFIEKSMKDENSSSSKEELQLKLEEIRASKEERIEDKRHQTVVKSEKWKTLAAIFVAIATTVGVMFAALNKPVEKSESKKDEVKVTR